MSAGSAERSFPLCGSLPAGSAANRFLKKSGNIVRTVPESIMSIGRDGLPFIYDERMRRSIAKFKYEGRREYAAFYAEEIVRSCGREAALWQAQALVPVPLHPSRRRKRGFNQAEVLAEELSRWMGIPVERKILIRSKKTRAQKQLNDQERVSNLKMPFLSEKDPFSLRQSY